MRDSSYTCQLLRELAMYCLLAELLLQHLLPAWLVVCLPAKFVHGTSVWQLGC
jgi:hypothetical protein